MLRDFIVAAGAALALASRVLAVEVDNFNLESTQDLVALCSVRSDEPLYAEALQFCYGYMAGVAQLHRALVHDNLLEPVACPEHEVTREALVQVVLDWVRANLDVAGELPAESVKRAAAAAWPCGT
jgi:hypothetical protein